MAHWCGWCQRFEIGCEMSVTCRGFKVSDRIRTGDRLDHNQELYQLSYAHRALFNVPGGSGVRCLSKLVDQEAVR